MEGPLALTGQRSFVILRGPTMVSSTQQYERIRRRKATTNGKKNKRARLKVGTPAFPIHQAGYDASAADAKPAAKK